MGFWANTLSNVIGGVIAGALFVVFYVVIQWFLHLTDLAVSYNWSWKTVDGVSYFYPNFDIRNRSRSKTYRLANIAYTRDEKPVWFDNKSLWGVVLEPESINVNLAVGPVKGIRSPDEALGLEVTIRTQAGRSFWLKGTGPGQMGKGRVQRFAFRLREKLGASLIPLE
jgi:hypothetical protein